MRDRVVIVDILTKKFKSICYKQYDENNELNIVVYEGKTLANISNYIATVYFELPSGKVYEVEGRIVNNTIKVMLSSSILEEYGQVNVECELVNLDEIVTTFTFYLNVEKSISRVSALNPNTQHTHSNLDVLNQITQEMVDSIGLSGGLVDLSIYQTKRDTTLETDNKTVSGAINELNKKIENTSENIDLSDYALKSEIPTRVSQLQNDSNFISSIPEEYVTEQELAAKGLATETFVTNKIAEASLSGGEVDLSGYATKDELKTKANVNHTHMMSDITDLVIPDVDKAYVDTQLNTKANKSDIPNLDGYALKTEIPTVPTKVSDLTNDSNFISSIPSEYITETELNAKGYLTEHQSLEDYALKTELPTKTSQLTNDSGFITEHQNISGKADKSYVDTELAKKSDKTHVHSYNDLSDKPVIPSVDGLATKKELTDGLATKSNTNHTHDQYLTEHQDISGKANKSEIPTKLSQLQNDSNFISSIPEEYITETELNAKGYLTSVPSEYVTETELEDKGYLTEHQDLSKYALKTEIPSVPTKTSQLTNDEGYITSIPSEYITESELNSKGYLTQHQDISGKADKSEIPTKTSQLTNDSKFLTNEITELNIMSLILGNYTIEYNETDDTLDFIYNGVIDEPMEEIIPLTWVVGNLSGTDGSETELESTLRSGFVTIEDNCDYSFYLDTSMENPGSIRVYFYDTNKTFISRTDGDVLGYLTGSYNSIDVPTNAAYMRFKSNIDNTTTINNINSLFTLRKTIITN